MNDKMLQAQGGLYMPEELASAYAKRGDRIEELSRNNRRLDARIAELEEVTAAVTVLVNWANKDKADWADLEDRIDSLEAGQHNLSSNVEEVRSDLDDVEETGSKLDAVVRAMRDAAAELASV